ncbi:hypothetical protein C7271_24685 [filamentous cyanobacterium CCP5]|nr:hypothetical protein C7271_24685 [filamentous cyanobacterium CCP5]
MQPPAAAAALLKAQNQREIFTQHEIKLELLWSAFSMAKLQVRQKIANEIAGHEGLALVA